MDPAPHTVRAVSVMMHIIHTYSSKHYTDDARYDESEVQRTLQSRDGSTFLNVEPSTVTRSAFDNDECHVTAFRPISEVGHTKTAVHIGVGDACSVVLVRCGRGFAAAESGRHSWRDQ